MLAQWLKSMGASQIFLFDLQPGKLELARKLGFDRVYNSREVDPTEVIEAATGGRGVHAAFEAAGVPPTTIAALKATRRSGRMILLGNRLRSTELRRVKKPTLRRLKKILMKN